MTWVRANDYPVLQAQVLLRLLDQANRLRSIERLVGATPEVFDELYLTAIETFAEAAQLVPASVCDHHREPGGWLDHTLEVVESALQARKRSILPPGSRPEAIHQVEHIWTYAVFAAALLHDAGKLLSLTQLKSIPAGETWTPGGLTLRDAQISRYAVTWARYPYELQTVSSVTLLGMLPKRGLSMLLGNQQVLRAMISTLTDDWQSGPLGVIVRNADQESVRQYVSPGIEHSGLPNAPVRSLSHHLMHALRVELDEGSLKLNTNGGVGWVKDGSVWLICKVTVRHIRERLDSEGIFDVPEDQRIYDILLEQGQLIPNMAPERQSIWYVTVACEEYTHHLTMLRFERSTIIHLSKQVGEFHGQISIRSREELLQLRADAKADAEGITSAQTTVTTAKQSSTSIPDPAPANTQTNAKTQPAVTDSLPPDADDLDAIDGTALQEPPPQSSINAIQYAGPTPTPSTLSRKTPAPQTITHISSSTNKTSAKSRKPSARDAATAAVVAQINTRGKVDRTLIITERVDLESEIVGRYFLTWVRDAVDASTAGFEVNDTKGSGLIHRIPEGILLVHPKIIQRFVLATGQVEAPPGSIDMNKNPDVKAAVDTVRKSLKNEKLLAKTAKGYEVHQADVSSTKNRFITSMLYGIVVPAWALFDTDELPPVNAAVTLWQGEYRTGSKIRPKVIQKKK